MQLTYSLALLAVFLVLLVGEFFVPSGGLIAVVATICAFTSIAIAFTHSSYAGVAVTGVIGLSTPAVLYLMVQFWPQTPIGRMILNRRPGQTDVPVESRLRSGEKRKDLVGRLGISKTDLLPSGLVEIDGKRVDAFSDGSPIDAGTRVIVTKVSAGKIRVRQAVEADIEPERVATERKTEAIEATLETLDLDQLDD